MPLVWQRSAFVETQTRGHNEIIFASAGACGAVEYRLRYDTVQRYEGAGIRVERCAAHGGGDLQ